MKFEQLRLVGFKSFVEPTDFEIRPGLTGIIGPNGCGKSNLLESLRWVMGATSAKALRGGGMEDVIFAGTNQRPARNWAEVTLTISNDAKTLPAEFNEHDTLEISRRILRKEEGAQSVYRVNGKEVRARDVQLLFADASTGANSPALVRQGQISELINAKPQNRRKLLEEAAGITGLYSRRHEAELRLRAAETNLERLSDVTGELESQRGTLARQARQATRYRNLSGHIRRTEAYSSYLRWLEATEALEHCDAKLIEINSLLEEATRATTIATTAHADAHEALEPLRQKEAEASAALHRLTVAMEGLDAELARARSENERLQSNREQLERDIAREKDLQSDATDALEQLAAEHEQLETRTHAEAGRLQEAEHNMTATAEARTAAETDYEQKNQAAVELEAARRTVNASLQSSTSRLNKVRAEIERVELEQEKVSISDEEAATLSSLREAKTDAVEARTSQEAAVSHAEDGSRQAQDQENSARSPVEKAQRLHAELKAEADAISRFLDTGNKSEYPALIEEVQVEAGYEAAIAAALGDGIDAALDSDADTHWSGVGAMSLISGSLPEESEYLTTFVTAPPALARRMTSIGVVAREDGDRLQAELMPGQRLVSREGDLWRWDGYVQRAEAKTAAAIRLEQKNRLDVLQNDIADAHASLQQATANLEEVKTLRQESQHSLEVERRKLKEMRQTERELTDRLSDTEKKHERDNARRIALAESLERLGGELEEARDAVRQHESSLADLPDLTELRDAASAAREEVSRKRALASEARAAFNDLSRERTMRSERLSEISRERGVWQSRCETANGRINELATRLEQTIEAQTAAAETPAKIEEQRKSLFDQLSVAEERRKAAADELVEAQQTSTNADKTLREAETEASNAREARARIEAQLDAAKERVEEAIELARENCDATPEELLTIAEHKEENDLPSRDDIDRKLERYKRERENLGGVNLRADVEMEEIDTRLTEINQESEDCEAAIRKLRSAIGNLNREGRQRLLEAFEEVNTNFQKLFTMLFGGGSAELKLIDSDDPLEAGLEIYASPPGKKLTSMSLMSGGEQALTATALIFAVFMSNPAPVCVLDEVDAPLDDANVDRFCQMLDEIVQTLDTKFIIITHHALTMSRMNRLYGVTMIERGVSQLVSVDLTAAENLIAAE